MLKKISQKLIVAMAAISLVAIGAFSYLTITAQRRALVRQVEHSALQLSETIKSSTRYAMLLNRRDDVHRIIDTVGAQQGIDKVRIFNKEGVIIYSREASAIGSMVDKRAEACYACHAVDEPLERLPVPETTRIFSANGTRSLGIINPIYNEPSCSQSDCHAHPASQAVLGVLDVTMPLAEVGEQMAASAWRIVLLASAAILAIAWLFWWFLRRFLVSPVRDLVEATDAVAAGNLGYRLRVRRSDELGRLAASFNDMTAKLAEAQRQIYQSDKLASLGRLAAGVAHEINNPLTGVLTYSSFLLRRAEEGSELHQDLETVVRETKRCREIVRSLLSFSRQMPSKRTEVDLPTVLGRAARIVGNQLAFANVVVEQRHAEGLPAVRGDENQLVQVFINLFVNAADAMRERGGRLTVETSLESAGDKGQVRIDVRDTGCGIEPADVGKIFDPFFTTKEKRGTGLGLAVTWGIIERHGGTITVASDLGDGTTFTVRLPVASPGSSPIAQAGDA